ncbi:MAG: membrane protein insertase YidC [Candidatus Lindowbacteria bacterium]|nr:membrane protein insertase YidC [Candidatus Lindowbacteria bacterium]
MNHEKRLWFAILLSMALVIGWNFVFPPPQALEIEEGGVLGGDTSVVQTTGTPSRQYSTAINTPGYTNRTSDTVYRNEVIADLTPRESIDIDLPYADLTFAETGGTLSGYSLKNYLSVTESATTRPVELVSTYENSLPDLALTMDESDRSRLSEMRWASESNQNSVKFSISPIVAELPSGIEISKSVLFMEEDYQTELKVTVTNQTNRDLAFSTGKLDYPVQGTSAGGSFLLHFGPGLGMNDPAKAYEEQYLVTGVFGLNRKMETASTSKSWFHNFIGAPDAPRGVDWVALQNRYFAMAVVPQDFKVDANFTLDNENRHHLWVLLPTFNLGPGKTKEFTFRMFSGPKKTEILTAFDEKLRPLDGMEPRVLPSNMAFARWMVQFLALIESVVGNWGYSIIILTILIRTMLFPLTHFQFKSMAKMSRLKPKIEVMQKKYADDKERMQRELMNVYKEAGVNPLGGCLPMVVQMPILIGLFIALQNAIDLRGVPFTLWIQDLSIPDTIFYIPGIGIPINPLPIAMGITMVIQQRITPTPTSDPNQKQMFTIMTLVMTVMFYNFPSGLSLYWLTQNVLSISQQYYMMKTKEDTDDGK